MADKAQDREMSKSLAMEFCFPTTKKGWRYESYDSITDDELLILMQDRFPHLGVTKIV